MADDYLKFIANLDYYLEQELKIIYVEEVGYCSLESGSKTSEEYCTDAMCGTKYFQLYNGKMMIRIKIWKNKEEHN